MSENTTAGAPTRASDALEAFAVELDRIERQAATDQVQVHLAQLTDVDATDALTRRTRAHVLLTYEF